MKWDSDDLKKVNDYKVKVERVQFDFDEEVGKDDFTEALLDYAFPNKDYFLKFLQNELYFSLWEKYKKEYLDDEGDVRIDWFSMDFYNLIDEM